MPETDLIALFEEFVGEYAQGRGPDPIDYCERAGDDGEALAQLLTSYCEWAPPPHQSPELLARSREAVQRLVATVEADRDLPITPTSLAELAQGGLESARRFVARLQVPLELPLAPSPAGALRGAEVLAEQLEPELCFAANGVSCRMYLRDNYIRLRFERLPETIRGERVFVLVAGADADAAPAVAWTGAQPGLIYPEQKVTGAGRLDVELGAITEPGDLYAFANGLTVMSERGAGIPDVMFTLRVPDENLAI